MRLFQVSLAALALAAAPAAAQDETSSETASAVHALVEKAAGEVDAGNLDDAEALLRQALEKDVKSVEANVALGRFLHDDARQAGTGSEGLALLWRAVGLDAKDEGAACALIDALLVEHAAYSESGDAMNADAQVARARKVLADHAAAGGQPSKEIRVRQARVGARSEGGEAAALALARQLVTDEPQDEVLHVLFVETAGAAKAFDEALGFYEKAAVEPWLAAWFEAELHVARAHMLFQRYTDDEKAAQDYLDAERLVLQSARLHPEVFEAASERASFYRSWRGWTRLRQERLDEAWDLFVAAWGRDPKNDNAIGGIAFLGQRLYEMGELDRARELYRQACEIAPTRGDFWNNYGLICRDTGHYEESYRAYLRAVELAPDDPRAVNDCYLLLLYHLHRDLDLAEREFIRAEDLARAKFDAANQGGDEPPIADARGVLGDVLVNLARLYSEQGRMQEAGEHWNELRAVDPGRHELPENGAEPPPKTVAPSGDAAGR
jgi:tetratricopeptide (TPR) repeat protein